MTGSLVGAVLAVIISLASVALLQPVFVTTIPDSAQMGVEYRRGLTDGARLAAARICDCNYRRYLGEPCPVIP